MKNDYLHIDQQIDNIINNRNGQCDWGTRETILTNIKNCINNNLNFNFDPISDPINFFKLKKTGFLANGKIFSDSQIKDIKNYFLDKKVFNSHVPPGSDGILRNLEDSNSKHNSYSHEDIIQCPHILEAALNQQILSIAKEYIGCVPTLYSINAWWTKKDMSTDLNIQQYHRDYDDFKFLSFFVYLVDVDLNTNPHVFIEKTHEYEIFEQNYEYLKTNDYFPPINLRRPEIYKNILENNTRVVTGVAGESFLVDTYGIHKALGNSSKDRLALWIRYGTHKNTPTKEQMPNPLNKTLINYKNIFFDEKLKYITRHLLR